MKILVHMAIFVVLTSSQSLFAGAPNMDRCVGILKGLKNPEFESSVETELGASPRIMAMFTTTDGTIAPVMGKTEIPEDVAKLLREAYPEVSDLKSIEWAALDHETQVRLIEYAAEKGNQEFFSNRDVPGLEILDSVDLHFTRRTQFMGKSFAPGVHTVNPRDFLMKDKVQFMGPSNMSKNLGFELHFRTDLSAGENLKEAWKFVRAVRGIEGSVHQHTLSKMPMKKLKSIDGPIESTRLTEYFARVNMFTEMHAVVNGWGILTKKDADNSGPTNFGPTNRSKVHGVFSYFSSAGKLNMGTSAKIGWVGFRGKHSYDGVDDVFGLEFRDLSPKYDHEFMYSLQDASQHALAKSELGIPEDRMERWVKEVSYKKPKRLTFRRMAQEFSGVVLRKRQNPELWKEDIDKKSLQWAVFTQIYYKNTKFKSSDFPRSLRNYLKNNDKKLSPSLFKVLNKQLEYNQSVGMLLKDWATDPMFFESPQVLDRIHRVQYEALERIARGEKHGTVMDFFLKRSGIYHAYGESLGLDLKR